MRKIYFVFAAIVCMSVFTMKAADWYPTTVVKVAPDVSPPSDGNGALRAAVSATAGPAIYELQRGGVYYVGGTCGFGVHNTIVRAEEGDGPRPVIVPYTLTGTSNDVFNGSGNLRLENLFVYGQEIGENAPMRRSIHRYTGGTAFEYEGCTFDGTSTASMLRYENLNADMSSPFTVTVNNCIFRNSVDYANIGNARGIDLRDSKGASVYVTNSTFFSISAQTIRQGTIDVVDELVFVNNTVYGSASAFVIGVAEKATIKNNIFYNPVLNGFTSEGLGSLVNIDAIEYPREIEILNNLFFTDPEFDALLDIEGTGRHHDSRIMNGAGYTLAEAEDGQLVIADTLSYAIDFKNPPASLLPFYTFVWENNAFGTAIPEAGQTFIRREVPPFAGDDLGAVAPYDFSYPNTHPAATDGEGGTYLGAWAPYEGSGIKSVVIDGVKCYFDAVSKKLNINSSAPIVKVAVYSPAGTLVASQLVTSNGQTAEYKPVGLSHGVYLYVVENPGGSSFRGKFVY